MSAPDELWAEITLPGGHPDLVARVVARALSTRGGPATVLRRAIETARTTTDGGAVDPAAILAAVAGDPGPAALEAAMGIARQWRMHGVRVALAGDPAYPQRLLADWPADGSPLWLAVRGALVEGDQRPAVAIVGARRATPYGTGIAAWLAEAASAAGARVVSGGALGIDAAAHAAAASGRGGTVVVLGCGHGVDYPRPHAIADGLFERVVAAGGAVVSELLPAVPPRAHTVRTRNRIVAGMADVVVVVEGGERSGALLTAGAAADRGVPVLAVPGDVRAAGSGAPHRLLSEGAAPCTGPADLLEALGASPRLTASADAPTLPSVLPDAVRRALDAAWPRPLRLDVLAVGAAVPAATLMAAVTRARIAGEVAESVEGIRLTRAPAASPPRGSL